MNRARSFVRSEPWMVALAGLVGAAYAVYAVVRHEHFQTGFDLAIFDQAVWNLAHLREPASTVKGIPNIWGDHLHLIIVTLAPLRALWPSPAALLTAQALLVAASAIPVFLFSRDRLGRGAAYGFAAGYVLFWGLQRGISFEFHEIAFAPLLIALCILFLDRRSWPAFWVSIALLLLVKEDQSLLVVAFGVVLLTLGERRRGAIAIGAGVGWYVLATKLLIPHVFGGGGFSYWSYDELGSDLPGAVVHLLTHPWQIVSIPLDDSTKRVTLLALFAPFLLLTLRSRLLILAAPLLAERFFSSTVQFWGTDYHYSMAIAPVLAMGAAAGLAALAPRRRQHFVVATAVAVAVANIVAALLILPPGDRPVARVVTPSFYRADADADAIGNVLAAVPGGASVAAWDAMVPHLTERKTIGEIVAQTGTTDYIATGLVKLRGSISANGTFRGLMEQVTRRLGAYAPVAYDDGWVVLRRGPGQGVLPGMGADQAREFAPSLGRWATAQQAAFSGFGLCPRRGSTAAAVACLRQVSSDYSRAQRELDTRLGELRLTGGCGQLRTLARRQNRRYSADLDTAAQAAIALRVEEYTQATKRLGDDITGLDLPGLVTRFWILCGAKQIPVSQGGLSPL